MGLDRLKYLAGIVFLASISIFLRFSLFGYDSHATHYVIKTGVNDVLANQGAAVFLFQLIPDYLLVFKVIMFLSLLLSTYILFLLVNKFFEERVAWLSVLFLFASTPFLLFDFAKFENELFAYPLILLGLYFLFCKKWYFFVPLVLSLPFWLWAGYFIPTFGSGVLELQLFAGLFNLFFGLFFVLTYFFQRNKWNLFLGIVFLGFGLWSSHLIIFLLPIVVLGIAQAIKMLEL